MEHMSIVELVKESVCMMMETIEVKKPIVELVKESVCMMMETIEVKVEMVHKVKKPIEVKESTGVNVERVEELDEVKVGAHGWDEE